jgi:hypothetical protein
MRPPTASPSVTPSTPTWRGLGRRMPRSSTEGADVSRFSLWRRENVVGLPWNAQVLADDLHTYAVRGIRCITSFAVWIDDKGPPRMSSISRKVNCQMCT